MRRLSIKEILADSVKWRELMVRCIISTQAREGIETTREQAEAAYGRVQKERTKRGEGVNGKHDDYR